MAKCAKCGSEMPAGASACPSCGTAPVTKRKGRTLLTVLLSVFGGLLLLCVVGALAVYFGTRGPIDKGKVKRSMAEVRTIATAC